MPLPFSQLLQDLRRAQREVARVNNGMPRIIGVETEKVIKENFKIQGYDAGTMGVTPWVARDPKTNRAYDHRTGGVKGSVINSENPILKQTGNLRDHITYRTAGKSVQVGVDLGIVPYAQIHNEGGTIHIKARHAVAWFHKNRFTTRRGLGVAKRFDVGAHTITMPKRQFMPLPGQGMNPKMAKRIRGKIDYEYQKVMKLIAHVK